MVEQPLPLHCAKLLGLMRLIVQPRMGGEVSRVLKPPFAVCD